MDIEAKGVAEKCNFYKLALDKRQQQSRFKQLRHLHFSQNEQNLLHFTSMDFLGLSTHPFVKKITIKYILQYGTGSQGSRLLTEHLEKHEEIEDKLASLIGTESAILYQGEDKVHDHLLKCLANQRSLIFMDGAVDAHIAKAAQASGAQLLIYNHNSPSHLEELLKEYQTSSCNVKMILTESVFSSEGDLCYLKFLSNLSEKYGALLYVDDSASFGIMGELGMGFAAKKKGIDIIVGSIGKKANGLGFYIATNALVKEYLHQFSIEFSHLEPLPPANLGAIDAALDIIPDMHAERQQLSIVSQSFRKELYALGMPISQTTTHIICLKFAEESELQDLNAHLLKNHIVASAIASPYDKQYPFRLKFILSYLHSSEQINNLLDALKSWEKPLVYEKL